jgi:hypothetical protein
VSPEGSVAPDLTAPGNVYPIKVVARVSMQLKAERPSGPPESQLVGRESGLHIIRRELDGQVAEAIASPAGRIDRGGMTGALDPRGVSRCVADLWRRPAASAPGRE